MGPSPLSLNGQYRLLSPLAAALQPTNTTPAEQQANNTIHACNNNKACVVQQQQQQETYTSSRVRTTSSAKITQLPRPSASKFSLRRSSVHALARFSDLREQPPTATSHLSPAGAKMSVAVCRGPAAVPAFEAPCWLRPVEPYKQPEVVVVNDDRPAQVDVWNAIVQADVDNNKVAAARANKPYVHPLVRRSSRLMSQKSLEVCTESLGNETGSGDFTSSLDMASLFDSPAAAAAAPEEPFWQQQQQHDAAARCCEEEQWESKGLAAVNYHCSAGTRSPRRSFPPPLPSMSRRDGPCLQMRTRRQDGRLVVEAVAVRPRGYLHARRQGGRLRLSFVECSARDQSAASKITEAAAEAASYFPTVEPARNVQEEEDAAVEMEAAGDDEVMEEEEEEEEEVEVVDRGTVVEVKVSTQAQAHTAAKVHRSTLVINKFVGSTPLSVDQPRCDRDADTTAAATQPEAADTTCDETETAAAQSPRPTLRRVPSSTTTLAAAVAVASTGTDDAPPAAPEDDDDECGGLHLSGGASAAAETKQQLLLSFTSRRGDKQDLLQSVRRCRQLRQKKLFILEPYCIATS